MKSIFLSISILFSQFIFAQEVIPMVDFSGFFKSFQNGFFRQLEFQRIEGFKAGDNVVGYIDNRGNLMVFNGDKPEEISNLEVEYEVSDNFLIWKVGSTLNLWDDGQKRTLSFDARNYWMKDSLVVYEDLRYNTVNAYYNGEIYTLYRTTNDLNSPDFVGDNVVAFRDNGNYHKIFWRGEIYDIDVWHNKFHFEAGTDVVVFNDLITGTFVVFENGKFIDVEDFHMDAYKAGRGFVVYENQNGELIYYGNGIKKQLTNFAADWWQVTDDIVLWSENGFTYAHMYLQKIELARYQPEEFLIKNGVVAFRNASGGVSAFANGKIQEITTQMNSSFSIHGNSVLVELFNNSYIVFQKGRKYTL